ncbi:MAG TPA: hypothetical protein VIK87_02315 [Sphingomonadales bacterium]
MKITTAVLALIVLSACARADDDLATLRYHAAMHRWCLSSPDVKPCAPYAPDPTQLAQISPAAGR